VQIRIEDHAKEFIRGLPEKDRRIIGEHIEELINHPNAHGNIKRLKTKKPHWRMHISWKYTLFFSIETDTILIEKIMTIEQAHKKYGKI